MTFRCALRILKIQKAAIQTREKVGVTMGDCIVGTFISSTGQELDKRVWLPEGAPKGIVQFVHGMAEHMDRYDAPAQALCQGGYLVVGHTHLGHGPKAEVQGHFADESGWERLLDDIHSLRQETEKAYPGVPYFLLGHSMGSFLVRCYLTEHGEGLRGAVLSGTGWFGSGPVKAGLALTGLLCALGQGRKPAPLVDKLAFGGSNKHFAPNRTAFDWLSRDAAQVDRYIADPYCGFLFTAAGYRELFRGLDRLRHLDELKKMPKRLPVYFFGGDQDPVGAMGKGIPKVAEQFRQAGLRDVTVKLYPGGRHEMFNETNAQEVYADLLAWLHAH